MFVAPISVLPAGPVPIDEIPLLPEQRRADIEVCKVLVLGDINIEILQREGDVSCWWTTQPDAEIWEPEPLPLCRTAPCLPLLNWLGPLVSLRSNSWLTPQCQSMAATDRATI